MWTTPHDVVSDTTWKAIIYPQKYNICFAYEVNTDDGGQSKRLLIGFHSTTPRPLIQTALPVLLTACQHELSAAYHPYLPASTVQLSRKQSDPEPWRHKANVKSSQLTRTVELHAEKSDWHILDFFFFKSSAALLNQHVKLSEKWFVYTRYVGTFAGSLSRLLCTCWYTWWSCNANGTIAFFLFCQENIYDAMQ